MTPIRPDSNPTALFTNFIQGKLSDNKGNYPAAIEAVKALKNSIQEYQRTHNDAEVAVKLVSGSSGRRKVSPMPSNTTIEIKMKSGLKKFISQHKSERVHVSAASAVALCEKAIAAWELESKLVEAKKPIQSIIQHTEVAIKPLNPSEKGFKTYIPDNQLDNRSNGVIYDQGKYVGNTLNGLPHGLGVITMKNGDVYNGKWKEGKIDEAAVFQLSSGDQYWCTWKEGKIEKVHYVIKNDQDKKYPSGRADLVFISDGENNLTLASDNDVERVDLLDCVPQGQVFVKPLFSPDENPNCRMNIVVDAKIGGRLYSSRPSVGTFVNGKLEEATVLLPDGRYIHSKVNSISNAQIPEVVLNEDVTIWEYPEGTEFPPTNDNWEVQYEGPFPDTLGDDVRSKGVEAYLILKAKENTYSYEGKLVFDPSNMREIIQCEGQFTLTLARGFQAFYQGTMRDNKFNGDVTVFRQPGGFTTRHSFGDAQGFEAENLRVISYSEFANNKMHPGLDEHIKNLRNLR